ncbi:hypothetical protein [Clostridium sp. DJ247]|uniref:hypothetical protein n=1 Tax=Clostridium sp. DJ247 TaxID=2726188 RepID=UPI001623DBC1|nr:hypothetical protein [Clostridium sp. DJ247]
MKLIIVNRKRLGVTVIIIGLMLVLLGLEKNFDTKLKFVALMQNNINSLKKYQVLGGKVTYKLPTDWVTEEKKFSGDEIIYHNDFTSKDSRIYGFVEIWNLNKDLKIFLDESKKISSEQNMYVEYNINQILINNMDGYLVNYTIINSANVTYKGYEYFLRNKGKFVRFSFFVKEDNFKENMPTIFKTIVQTIQYRE